MSHVEGPRRPTRDWQLIRERLARACDAAQDSSRLSPEAARAILEERARVLAAVPAPTADGAEVVEVLTFSLGDERYAIGTSHVREVLRLRDCVPVPGTPPVLIGITNVRGHILPLFDLAELIGLSRQESPGDNARIMVLGEERAEVGVLTDAVLEVLQLRAEMLNVPEVVPGGAREFVRGVTEHAVIVLDGAALLRDSRLVIDLDGDREPASGSPPEKP